MTHNQAFRYDEYEWFASNSEDMFRKIKTETMEQIKAISKEITTLPHAFDIIAEETPEFRGLFYNNTKYPRKRSYMVVGGATLRKTHGDLARDIFDEWFKEKSQDNAIQIKRRELHAEKSILERDLFYVKSYIEIHNWLSTIMTLEPIICVFAIGDVIQKNMLGKDELDIDGTPLYIIRNSNNEHQPTITFLVIHKDILHSTRKVIAVIESQTRMVWMRNIDFGKDVHNMVNKVVSM